MKRRGAQQHHRLAANICLVSYRRSARKTVAQCSHRLREAHIMQRTHKGNREFCQQVALLVKHAFLIKADRLLVSLGVSMSWSLLLLNGRTNLDETFRIC